LSGQHLTPIIDDNGKVTHETWDIANYLEDRFPDRPSLFGGVASKGMARFINVWSDTQLSPPLRRVIYADSGWSGFIEVDYDDKTQRNQSEIAGIKVITITQGRGRRKTAR
jgi:glutathione S-transferase